jgi:hypothetical protein
VLLKAGGQEVRGWPYGAIVFDASGDFFGEVELILKFGEKTKPWPTVWPF